MNAFTIAFNAVLPIFLMIVLGFGAKSLGVINQDFVNQATRFVFRISLPVLIYRKVSAIDLSESFEVSQVHLMVFCFIGIIVGYFIAKGLARFVVKDPMSKNGYVTGTFILGCSRSNYVIIGYPVLLNLFGDAVVVNMALVTLMVIPIFNVLAIIALTPPDKHNGIAKFKEISLNIIKNPLIIALVFGFITAELELTFPRAIDGFLAMVAGLATPLALVAIGAFFHFDGFRETISLAGAVTFIKLLLLPAIMTTAAYLIGLEPMNIILVGVLFGGPTSVSSFAMSSELGGDPVLAGNIIILTSGLCAFSYMLVITVWLSILGIA